MQIYFDLDCNDIDGEHYYIASFEKQGILILNGTIIVLSSSDCTPSLSERARFCLDVAKETKRQIDEIWILGQADPLGKAIFTGFEDVNVRYIQLDQDIWPLDVGNNQYLEQPLTLYSQFRTSPVKSIISPLKGGAIYFVLMAKASGLIAPDCHLITTCYLPRCLELEGRLILPTELQDVIESELESKCANMVDELWVTHESLIDDISDILSLTKRTHIKSKVLLRPQSVNPLTRHLIFKGPLAPLYGFDAFCDLVDLMSADIEKVTIFAPEADIRNSIPKVLRGASFELKLVSGPLQSDVVADMGGGILISPMRTAVMPNSVREATAAGVTSIWGHGFTLPAISDEPPLHPTISDVRKIALTLNKIWEIETDAFDRVKPIALPNHTGKPFASKEPSKPVWLTPVKTVSVILLHHNRLEFLKDALRSLEAQTLDDFEVIIVDDGSEQAIKKDVEALAKASTLKNVSVSFIENSYPSVARNHGVSLATGDAVFFLDDDNIIDAKTLTDMKAALQQHEIVLSFFQTLEPDGLESLQNTGVGVSGKVYSFAGLLPGTGIFYNLVGNSSLMMRAETFKALGGFTPKYGVGLEDYAFLTKAAFQARLSYVVLPEPYLHFRLHPDKIRNTHIDWRSDVRLQAGHWRLLKDLGEAISPLPRTALAYARQMHELTQYQYVNPKRPKYFRLRSVLIHQYLLPILSKRIWLRKWVNKFTSGESRLAKRIENWFF